MQISNDGVLRRCRTQAVKDSSDKVLRQCRTQVVKDSGGGGLGADGGLEALELVLDGPDERHCGVRGLQSRLRVQHLVLAPQHSCNVKQHISNTLYITQ